MKKILVYKTEVLPFSETFIKLQIINLRRWHGVLAGDYRLPNGLSLDGLEVVTLLDKKPGLIGHIWRKLNLLLGRAIPADVAKLKTQKADLFQIHFGTELVQKWPLIKDLGIPIICTLHGFDVQTYAEWWHAGKGGMFMKNYPERFRELANHPNVFFIAVSKAIEKRAIEIGVPAHKIGLCYDGVDTKHFKPEGLPITQRNKRVVFVGRLAEKKGCTYLIEAIAKVKQTVPDIELVIIGDGPLRESLEAQARPLGESVKFLGAQPSTEVKKEMDKSRCVCVCSISASNGDAEGLPIVIFESQSSGVPILTSIHHGDTEGIIEGKSGFGFREKDVAAMTRLITKVMTDDALAESLSKAGREYMVQRYDIDVCTNELEDYLDRILSGKSQ